MFPDVNSANLYSFQNITFKERERLPESRKLPLESFLARPTTKMGRYPLMLEQILSKTEEGSSDREIIPVIIIKIKEILSDINVEAGKSNNNLKLNQLEQRLVFNTGEVQVSISLGVFFLV